MRQKTRIGVEAEELPMHSPRMVWRCSVAYYDHRWLLFIVNLPKIIVTSMNFCYLCAKITIKRKRQ